MSVASTFKALYAALDEEERIDSLMDKIFRGSKDKEQVKKVIKGICEKIGGRAVTNTDVILREWLTQRMSDCSLAANE